MMILGLFFQGFPLNDTTKEGCHPFSRSQMPLKPGKIWKVLVVLVCPHGNPKLCRWKVRT